MARRLKPSPFHWIGAIFSTLSTTASSDKYNHPKTVGTLTPVLLGQAEPVDDRCCEEKCIVFEVRGAATISWAGNKTETVDAEALETPIRSRGFVIRLLAFECV